WESMPSPGRRSPMFRPATPPKTPKRAPTNDPLRLPPRPRSAVLTDADSSALARQPLVTPMDGTRERNCRLPPSASLPYCALEGSRSTFERLDQRRIDQIEKGVDAAALRRGRIP